MRPNLLTKDEHIKYCFKHFSIRLWERYKIDDLTYKEYLDLYNAPFTFLYRLTENKVFCALTIKGMKVYAIRDKSVKCFSTCLIIGMENRLPLPSYIRAQHITSQQVTSDLALLFELIKQLQLDLQKMTDKEFFTQEFLYPKWVYSVTHYYNRYKNYETLFRAIYHLYREPLLPFIHIPIKRNDETGQPHST